MHLKCSLLSLFRFKKLGSFHSRSCPPFCCIPVSSGDPMHTKTVTLFSDPSSLYASTVQFSPIVPHLLLQGSCLTLAFKLLILLPPTLYFLPLHPRHYLLFLVVSLHLLLSFPLLTSSGFFNGILGVSEPIALNYYTFFCLILFTLFLCRNLTVIDLPLSESLNSLLCDLIAPTPDLVFFLLMSQMLAAA